MTKEKYRTNELCQYDYSEIWERSFDEETTDKPLRNDEIVDLLNQQTKIIEKLKKENQGLQFKIIDMLDFIKEQGSVTREEIKKWWNK